MHRAALFCVLSGLSLTVVALGQVEQGKQQPQAESATVPTQQATAESERARTLLELRKELGGSLLEGTLLNSTDSADTAEVEFLHALQSQTSAKPAAKADSTEACEDRYQQSLAEPTELPTTTPLLAERIGNEQLPYGSPTEPSTPELSAVLRTASRHLDSHANDLEDMGEYLRGDELRRLSQRIRQVAREVREVGRS